MIVCRHRLHNGFIAYMLIIGKSTMQQIFAACVVFMEEVFSKITFRPVEGFLAYNMPEIFIRTWHWPTDIVMSCTGLAN